MPTQDIIVSLCNQALTQVGGREISGLGDTSRESQLCNLYAVASMREVLSSLDWGFARRIAPPQVLQEEPRSGYTATLAYPPDAVTVRSLSDELEGWYEPENRFEVADNPSGGKLVYGTWLPERIVYTTEDWHQADPMFLSAWRWRLAWHLAYPLSKDDGLRKAAFQIAEAETQRAMAISLNQGLLRPHPRLDTAPWIRGR